MERRCLLFGLLLAVAVAVGRGSSTWGQAQVGSGHSLDANLMVGSGGYNGVGRRAIQGRAAFRRPAYSVGSRGPGPTGGRRTTRPVPRISRSFSAI